MSILTNALHPTFESLSAYADQGELDGSRTRVGRHVARCASCRAVVAELRSYGEAVRATEMPAAPAGLWSRIQAGLDSAVADDNETQRAPLPDSDRAPRGTPSPDADAWRAAPALRPTRHVPSPFRQRTRRVALALAAAAVIVAVLLVPTSKGDKLQASPSAGTWRFSPARPQPGATVNVRFEPPANMKTQNEYVLLGSFTSDSAGIPTPRGAYWYGLNDSLTTLVRQSDGSYAGRFQLPARFRAMMLSLTDIRGGRRRRIIMSPDGPVNRDIEPVAMLVAGNARGEPWLEALTSALELWSGQRAEPYAVADTLIRYFPSEPIGYAADRRVGGKRLVDDLIAYFNRGERQYVKFDRKLMAEPVVSAEREIAMIEFAYRIDEPAEARKWTTRLIREHPEDPRALEYHMSMLHQMLLRSGTVDSVRAELPLVDSMWERNGHRLMSLEPVRIASTVGDTAAARRWSLRAFTSGLHYLGENVGLDPALLRDAEARKVAEPLLRQFAAQSCAVPAGKVPFWSRRDDWTYQCELHRASTFGALSYAARLDGRLAQALALADSSLAVTKAAGGCYFAQASQRRGEALLAMHDTAAAIPLLARGVGYQNWQAMKRKDSLAVVLEGAISRAQWDSLVQQGSDEVNACAAARTRRERERREAEAREDRAGK